MALTVGGSVDMIARTLGQKLNASLGQAFVVDNRAGTSGQIGMPAVSKAWLTATPWPCHQRHS